MKILINLFGIGFILLFSHFYKTESSSVEGMWLTADKLSKIQIYEKWKISRQNSVVKATHY
jgi:hypothetical protein